jgi:hypothetical protein
MERDVEKLKESLKKSSDDHQKIIEQNTIEFMQLKTEKETEVAKLKGENITIIQNSNVCYPGILQKQGRSIKPPIFNLGQTLTHCGWNFFGQNLP